jgi:hypothetical protein
MWIFGIIFENYSMRTLSKRENDFIAHWAYVEPISSHTEHPPYEFSSNAQCSMKFRQFLYGHLNVCWAYAETILSHAEHTRNEFYRTLSMRRNNFVAHWGAYSETIFIAWWAFFLQKEGWTAWWSIHLLYGGGRLFKLNTRILFIGPFYHKYQNSSGNCHTLWNSSTGDGNQRVWTLNRYLFSRKVDYSGRKVGYLGRKTHFSAEEIPFQRPYFRLEFESTFVCPPTPSSLCEPLVVYF